MSISTQSMEMIEAIGDTNVYWSEADVADA